MEVETVVNGSHEPENNQSEKILKPKKPKHMVVNSKEHKNVMHNGNSETSSVSGVTESYGFENGHVDEVSKQNGDGTAHEDKMQELNDSSPRKLRRDSRKESTPKPETPIKRELRRREATPRASTPKKSASSTREPSHENQNGKSNSQIKDHEENNLNDLQKHDNDMPQENNLPEKSVIILDDTKEEEIISVNESVEVKEAVKDKNSSSNLSMFRKSLKSDVSAEMKDSIEASTSTSSVICLGTPNGSSPFPNKEIKGRKPINSFSKFPGRTVSIISLDSPLKRKVDEDFFDDTEKKRFAGDIENGSEKSPGWRFFSSWSPAKRPKLQSSTPFRKQEQDSMTVNYNEETNLSLGDLDGKEASAPNALSPKKWCSIM